MFGTRVFVGLLICSTLLLLPAIAVEVTPNLPAAVFPFAGLLFLGGSLLASGLGSAQLKRRRHSLDIRTGH